MNPNYYHLKNIILIDKRLAITFSMQMRQPFFLIQWLLLITYCFRKQKERVKYL